MLKLDSLNKNWRWRFHCYCRHAGMPLMYTTENEPVSPENGSHHGFMWTSRYILVQRHILPETKSLHLKIGHSKFKKTSIFRYSKLLVSGRANPEDPNAFLAPCEVPIHKVSTIATLFCTSLISSLVSSVLKKEHGRLKRGSSKRWKNGIKQRCKNATLLMGLRIHDLKRLQNLKKMAPETSRSKTLENTGC